MATARRLPQFQGQVTELERKLENLRAVLPEQKDVADILRRMQTGHAVEPRSPALHAAGLQAETLYAEIPFKLQPRARTTTWDSSSIASANFPRIINISEITIKAQQPQEPNASIDAECVATTFVLQEAKAQDTGRGGVVPKQPSGK